VVSSANLVLTSLAQNLPCKIFLFGSPLPCVMWQLKSL